MSRRVYELKINGVARSVEATPNRTLADLLREIGLQGCKTACDSAVCGSCTVLQDGQPVAACSTFVFEAEGSEVLSIEGLEGPEVPGSLQSFFLNGDAFQCGFCTAGMILSTHALLAANPSPDEATIRAWLKGNLCRCTGYQMIVETVQRAALARMQAAATER